MPSLPNLIVDLHTHLFNARCLPLPGIIANAMNKDASESRLARAAASLLYRLTEAEYRPQLTAFRDTDSVGFFVDQLCELTSQELAAPFRENLSPTIITLEFLPTDVFDLVQQQISQSDLYACLTELEAVLIEDGYIEPTQNMFMGVSDITDWAKKIVAATFNTLEDLISLRDEITNYAKFFFNMLHAEEHMAHTLINNYGDQLPPLQIVHHMMDMQMAYVTENTPASMVAPKYAFNETQLLRMQDLARHNQGKIFGFSAFDPRRSDWRDEIVEKSIAMGFKGFKFYPALGYLPIGNKDAMGNDDVVIEQRVLDFFRLCIKQKIPVFTHCTPTGFQTRFKKGLNASPKNWEALLSFNSGEFAELRLCFGHAGGGKDDNNGFRSPGWTAGTTEWEDPNNYACTVARLCRTYENVYCEFAYITELIENSQAERDAALNRFEENLLRAMKLNPGERYDFEKKICYGSDWHMPSMVDHPRAYLEVFLRIFDDNKPLAKFREQFFWENAYDYLQLSH